MTNSAPLNGSQGHGDQPSQAELSDRRDRLNRKLEEHRGPETTGRSDASKSSTKGYGQAMKISSEFIAGILVGGGIGWVLDMWLDTGPFGLIVFLLLGFAAGVLNVLRTVGYVAEPESMMEKTDAAGGDPDGPSSK